jgi:Heterokaryon incompatibility protein (HET)/Clr5 domain
MHSEEEWERVKQPFHKAYIDQNKSLKESASLMNQQYGFLATQRQWERKMQGWGFRKNTRGDTRQQFIDRSLAAGMTQEQILNAPGIPVDESRADDRNMRRNWRRFVKRQNVRSRSRSTPTTPATTTNRVPEPNSELNIPQSAISDLSAPSSGGSPMLLDIPTDDPTSAGRSSISSIPEIRISLYDEGSIEGQYMRRSASFPQNYNNTLDAELQTEPFPYLDTLNQDRDAFISAYSGESAMIMPEQSFPTTKTFRLVALQPGTGEEEPVLQKFESALETPYEALSYNWGDLTRRRTIMVNKKAEQITNNLYDAIKALRYPNRTRVLWIDAICINQRDVEDRNYQVSIMNKIYEGAMHVCIWLGAETPQSVLAVEFVRTAMDVEQFDKLFDEVAPSVQWEAFSELTKRPWFSRLWVLQEVVLAKSATVYWGSHQIAWADCVDALTLVASMRDRIPRSWHLSSQTKYGSAFPQSEESSALRFVQVSNRVVRKNTNGGWKDNLQSLETLLSMTRSLQITDPRDRIYALIGLASDTTSILISPNYSKTAFRVYSDYLYFHFQQSGSLDILCLPWSSTSDVPSWIGTNTEDVFQVSPWGDYRRVHADLLSVDPHRGTRIYNASGKLAARFHFDSKTERSLFVQGIEVSKIKTAASVARAGCIPADWLGLAMWQDIQKLPPDDFWRTLVADRSLESSESPPTFYARACQWAFRHTVKADDLNTSEMISSPHVPSTVVTFLRRVQAVVWKRKLIRTYSDYIGLAPEGTTSEDVVAVLLGCTVPMILRAVDSGTQSFKLIGECYIHELMNGEAFRYCRSNDFKTFELI